MRGHNIFNSGLYVLHVIYKDLLCPSLYAYVLLHVTLHCHLNVILENAAIPPQDNYLKSECNLNVRKKQVTDILIKHWPFLQFTCTNVLLLY